jgi:hypothetical protein
LDNLIADQQESGIIESIFDGIVRLTGLDSIFYSELLFSINYLSYDLDSLNVLTNNLPENEADEEIEDVIENQTESDSETVFARLANDILLPFIFLNNKTLLNNFSNNSYEDLLNLEQKQSFNTDELPGINSLSENFDSYSQIFADESLKTQNNSTAINFDILNNVQDIFDETELAADLEALTENLTDETYDNHAEFLVEYVSVIYPIIVSVVVNAQNIDKKTLLTAIRNYFYALIESNFNDESVNLHEDDFSPIEANNEDELNIELNDDIATINKDEEETSSRTLMLVMGLERESIQAPMLTQTTQLYEGDLAWRTSQELEIYCSIEALGRISDIFLNSLE